MISEKNSLSSFLLGSLLTSYPDDYFVESVTTMLQDETLVIPTKFRNDIEKTISQYDLMLDLQSEYIDIFDRGRSINPIYETEYGKNRSLGKANELSDIAGFYKAFGFDLGDENTTQEMHDHISVELEFYALLMIKSAYLEFEAQDMEGLAIVKDARKKFLKDHLGRFASTLSQRPGVQLSPFYSQVFNWIAKLVEEECKFLTVEPLALEWFATERIQNESIECGALEGTCK